MKSWEIDLMMLRSELIFREYAERTQDIYIKTVEDFLNSTDKESCNIQREDVIRYLDRRLKEDSNNTVLVKLNALEFFFEEVLGLDITENIRKFKKLKREYKQDLVGLQDIDILLSSIPTRDRIILKTILETGEYPKHMHKWTISDLHSKEDGWYLKGHKLSKEFTKELLAYIEKFEITNYLFYGNKDFIDYTNIYLLLRKHTEMYLGRRVTVGELKHAVALELWKQGKVEEIKKYLGNQSLASIRQWYKMRGIILEGIR
ncbi:hypothetical protein A2U04_08185 [Fusobacterium necrophorum subsp. funduliforme]|uniref:phage integrase N-terminal SAM-like domain-containing protein n=1 Tax=Fusobacterium necrophorum TaxID=859 RepID=UPI000787DB18|nr:phage integrase N-terminal SAM-like domain-containing protein [Fusobacterium necrophorum]KYM47183.1 hypothetical protein A2U04_08185 [Fusobacterium necrophorum subsp. funduliforme]